MKSGQMKLPLGDLFVPDRVRVIGHNLCVLFVDIPCDIMESHFDSPQLHERIFLKSDFRMFIYDIKF